MQLDVFWTSSWWWPFAGCLNAFYPFASMWLSCARPVFALFMIIVMYFC